MSTAFHDLSKWIGELGFNWKPCVANFFSSTVLNPNILLIYSIQKYYFLARSGPLNSRKYSKSVFRPILVSTSHVPMATPVLGVLKTEFCVCGVNFWTGTRFYVINLSTTMCLVPEKKPFIQLWSFIPPRPKLTSGVAVCTWDPRILEWVLFCAG